MPAVYLLKSYCLPSLVYGCEVWQLRREDARNDSFRNILNAYFRVS